MRTTVQALALSAVVMIAADALALHRQTPFMLDITHYDGGQSFAPFAQGEAARWIAFHSLSDLKNNGSSGSEIFLFDNEPPRNLSQVTNCAFGESANAAATSNGSIVVFDTTSTLALPPSQRCLAAMPTRQIMKATRSSSGFSFTQLTSGNVDCTNARISTDGFRIIFQCTGDLRNNGSSGTHIFLYRDKEVCDPLATPPCSKAQQITPKGAGMSGNAEFDLQADKIVFNSDMAIDGNSNGFQQIWLYNIATQPPYPTPIRLTNGTGDSINPSMNQDGRLVVFQSQADLLGTGSSGWELFLLDRQTGILRQLTDSAGDSTDPSMGGGGRFISFLSTGDFGFGGGGPHLYLYDLIDDTVYQVTHGAGSAGHPVSTADTIFFFDSDEDPLGTGITGRQVYALNVFQQLPARGFGAAKFTLLPGTPTGTGGSSVRLTTASTFNGNPATSYITAPIGNPSLGAGEITLSVLGRNFDQEGAVSVTKVALPPIPVPSFGAICFQQTATGRGTIDCNGDTAEAAPDVLDYRTLQDHVTNEEDPFCQFGCREGSECPGPIQYPPGQDCPHCFAQPGVCADGPNQGQVCTYDTQCPGKEKSRDPITGQIICVPGDCGACDITKPRNDDVNQPHLGTCAAGVRDGLWCDLDSECPSDCLATQTCDGGPNDGATCTKDRDCDPDLTCEDGVIDVCQGPTVLTQSGMYGAGDMSLEIPMTAKISTNPGVDGKYCTGDDRYALSGAGMDSIVRLTTGKAMATITDVDYTQGLTIGASEVGAPFDCERWQNAKDLSGARLVGAATFLSVPNIPFQHDTILTFRFVADPGPPCVAGTCPFPCTDDSNCDDGDPCNGGEFCHLGNCQPGVPISCDDGNECNGNESCDSANNGMCVTTTGLDCNDDNPCTTDTCREDFLCIHSADPELEGQPCDDGNLCTGPDRNTGGVCDDPIPCDACHQGQCTGPLTNVAPRDCENNNLCDGIFACDPTTGTSCVQITPPLVCNPDNNPCTDDGCDPQLGCNPPNTAPCDDNNACTGPDVCKDRVCTSQLTPAAAACNRGDGNFCNGLEHCDPASGSCLSTPLDCDDLNPCTDDLCDSAAPSFVSACKHVNNTAACDDNNACTDVDACSGGTCVGTMSAAAITCNAGDGNVCNGIEQCNPATGACDATPLVCDDLNPCTQDSCDPIQGCLHVILTGLCDDGDACTVNDECVNGACLGAPTPVAISCGDGDMCNGVESCDPATGACVAGTPLVCDDGDGCTADTCDPASGCVSTGPSDPFDAILCEIDAIIDQLQGRPTDSIKGRKLPRKLLRLALRARTKVDLASRAANTRAVSLLGASDAKLLRFEQIVRRGFGLDRVQESLMHFLTDHADTARDLIQALKADLQGLTGTGGH